MNNNMNYDCVHSYHDLKCYHQLYDEIEILNEMPELESLKSYITKIEVHTISYPCEEYIELEQISIYFKTSARICIEKEFGNLTVSIYGNDLSIKFCLKTFSTIFYVKDVTDCLLMLIEQLLRKHLGYIIVPFFSKDQTYLIKEYAHVLFGNHF